MKSDSSALRGSLARQLGELSGDAPRILVVRLSARGDIVFASPLAGALRRRFPNAYLAWAAESHTADLIRHNPCLDEVIEWDRGRWKELLRRGAWATLVLEATEFAESLRARRFDVAIDVQGLLRSGVVTWLTGAPLRIGLGSREGSEWLMTSVVAREGDDRRFASEYLHLAGVLGLANGSVQGGSPPEDFRPLIPRSPGESERARRMLAEAGVRGPFVALCPFTTRLYKHWFEDRWAALIDRIPAETGMHVALLGGPGDRAAADGIVGAATPALANLTGHTTLGEAAAIVSRCAALVGVDTGLSHMAHAFGRPSVLLFGSNTPYLDPPSADARILHSGRDCSPCRGKLVCGGRVDCMRDLTVDQVFAALAGVLGEAAARAHEDSLSSRRCGRNSHSAARAHEDSRP